MVGHLDSPPNGSSFAFFYFLCYQIDVPYCCSPPFCSWTVLHVCRWSFCWLVLTTGSSTCLTWRSSPMATHCPLWVSLFSVIHSSSVASKSTRTLLQGRPECMMIRELSGFFHFRMWSAFRCLCSFLITMTMSYYISAFYPCSFLRQVEQRYLSNP